MNLEIPTYFMAVEGVFLPGFIMCSGLEAANKQRFAEPFYPIGLSPEYETKCEAYEHARAILSAQDYLKKRGKRA